MKFSIIFWVFATIIGLLSCLLEVLSGDSTSIILSIVNLAGIVCFLIYYCGDKSKINLMTAGITLMSVGAVHGLVSVFYK